LILDADCSLCITLIIEQQFWGYKVEEKLHLGVCEQKRLNTTASTCHKSDLESFVLYWGMTHARQISTVENSVDIFSTSKGYTEPFLSLEVLVLVTLSLAHTLHDIANCFSDVY
jgi:hypothetical protein